jgi:hypothetical protein
MNIIEATCLPGEGNNPSLADVQFHAVRSTPSLYTFDIALQQSAVISRTDSTKNFDIISKQQVSGVLNYNADVINRYTEKKKTH